MTVLNNRDVSAVVAIRLDAAPEQAQSRVDTFGAYARACHAKVDHKLKSMTDLREQILELEGQNSRYRLEVDRHGLKASEESERLYENRTKQIKRLKQERLRVQNEKLPSGGDIQERVEFWFARHGEPLRFAPPDPKPLKDRTTAEMFKITVEGVAELRAMLGDIDKAPLPLADGKRQILRDLDRLEKRGRVSVRPTFKLYPELSGRLRQGGIHFTTIRIPGGDGFEVMDPAAFVYLFRPEIEKRLLADAAKIDFSGALSMEEREADKAELRSQIDKVERDAAEWWWRCRAEGMTDLEPPSVPIPALLGVVAAEDGLPLTDEDDATATEDESPFVAEDDAAEVSDEDTEAMDFG